MVISNEPGSGFTKEITMDSKTTDRALLRAMNRFNEEMDTQYSTASVKHECYDTDNAVEVFERFCGRYFPDRLGDNYRGSGYFRDFIAMAFTGTECDGILYNGPFCAGLSLAELYEISLHELSHIFCVHNEIGGGSFYEKYCGDSGDVYTTGVMNAGYAVWREFIAGIIADYVSEYSIGRSLSDSHPEMAWHWKEITPKNPNAKRHFFELLFLLMASGEIALAHEWDDVRESVQELNLTDVEVFYSIVKVIWENLHEGECWEIDEEFIHSLGIMYVSLLTVKYAGK